MNTRKNFFKYIFFNMLSMIGMSCYILADTYFISNGVGIHGLTALNLILPIYNLIFGIGALIGVGGSTYFAIYDTQGQSQKANAFFTYAIIFSLFISIPFVLIGFFFSHDISMMMGANKEIINIASIYLRTFIVFTPFFILEHVVLSFIRNDHNPRLASIAMVSATLFNIIFDYILVYPCHLGMFGAALATGFAPIIALLICSLHFTNKNNHLFFKRSVFQIEYLIKIVKTGIPSLIMEISGGIIIFVFNMIILKIGGNIAIASYGVISNLAIVVTSLYTGIAQGVQPLLSQSYAKQNYEEKQSYLRYAYITSLLLSIIIYCIIFTFPEQIVQLFNSESNQTMLAIAREGLILYFTGYFFAGINMISISYCSAIEKAQYSTLLSLLRGGVIIIPFVIGLSHILKMTGVWLSFPISELIILCFSFYIFKKYKIS
jgi:putative MATE family efflux protein